MICQKSFLLLLIFLYWTVNNVYTIKNDQKSHLYRKLDTFAVEIEGNNQIANFIASHCQFVNHGLIGYFSNIYNFEAKNFALSTDNYTKCLHTFGVVKFARAQIPRKRILRRFESPHDRMFDKQWSLTINSDHFRLREIENINVITAWGLGFTGKGVIVAVLDNGIDYRVPELNTNFIANLSYDYFANKDSILPPNIHEQRHGTNVAGIVAAARDKTCGVGIAYDSGLVGIRIHNNDNITDILEALGLMHRLDSIDIYSNSWGPSDFGFNLDGPDKLALEALKIGAEHGRNGLGAIYVFSGGNGRLYHDNCGADGYLQQVYTIAVGAVGSDGKQASYSEHCSALLISAFSSSDAHMNHIVTTDTSSRGGCSRTFSGTSASCPAVSGGIALALQANPLLTWRDVQHILVETARLIDPTDSNWKFNSAGLHFNEKYGFGILDVGALVMRAKNWINAPPQLICSIQLHTIQDIPTIYFDFPVSTCQILFLEHLTVTLNLTIPVTRNKLEFDISSPYGTNSVLYSPRRNDIYSQARLINWQLLSVNFWGENPIGQWMLNITQIGAQYRSITLSATVNFYGTNEKPKSISAKCHSLCASLSRCSSNSAKHCDTCKNYRQIDTLECVDRCDNSRYVTDYTTKLCRPYQENDIHIDKNNDLVVRKNGEDRYLCTDYLSSFEISQLCKDFGCHDVIRNSNQICAKLINGPQVRVSINCLNYVNQTGWFTLSSCFHGMKLTRSCPKFNWGNSKCATLNSTQTCPLIPVKNGRIVTKTETEIGHYRNDKFLGVLIFANCHPNYVIDGKLYSFCNGKNNWTLPNLSCVPAKINSLRLTSQTNANGPGHLEIMNSNFKLTKVCISTKYFEWSNITLNVMCMQLGFDFAIGAISGREVAHPKVWKQFYSYFKYYFSCQNENDQLERCLKVRINSQALSWCRPLILSCDISLSNSILTNL